MAFMYQVIHQVIRKIAKITPKTIFLRQTKSAAGWTNVD